MNDADPLTRILGPHESRNISAVVTFITSVRRNIKWICRRLGRCGKCRVGLWANWRCWALFW